MMRKAGASAMFKANKGKVVTGSQDGGEYDAEEEYDAEADGEDQSEFEDYLSQ